MEASRDSAHQLRLSPFHISNRIDEGVKHRFHPISPLLSSYFCIVVFLFPYLLFSKSSILLFLKLQGSFVRTVKPSFVITPMGKFFHSSNTTCPAAPTSEAPNPFLGSLTFQHLITWVVLGFTGLTVAISLVTIFRHLFHYTYPTEQRQIVRIVFTPVVFSALSIFSIISYSASKYLLPIQEVYENFALASLFLLFVNYVSPDPHTRGPFFEQLGSPPKKGEAVSSGSRFAWFKKIWISIFLNAVAGAILGVVEIASQAAGTYCETSNNIHFAHIWIRILSTGLLTLAVVGTLRFYGRFKQDMAAHKPLLKLVSFKTIVFVNTIQTVRLL